MTLQTYKRSIITIFSLYVPLFVLDEFVIRSIKAAGPSDVSIAIYFVFRILSLYLLLFSIYAQVSGVKGTRLLESPITFIALGLIIVLLSFGPTIASYFLTSDIKTGAGSSKELKEIPHEVTNINITSGRRFHLARKYYLNNGERLVYFNDNNTETIYTPDDKTVELRASLVESRLQLEALGKNAKFTAMSLIGILVVSILTFIFFLWHRYKFK